MKVLLLGDASNYHRTLANGLAALGHQVTVASNGNRWMATERDIDLSRRPGKLGGLILWTKLSTVLSSRLKGYDVVQIVNPIFVEQRPQRVRILFDRLRRHNGRVFLTALATDTPYVGLCVEQPGALRYNEYLVGGQPSPYAVTRPEIRDAWLAGQLADHCRYVYDNVDGVVTALYEYHLASSRWVEPERIAYGGIPIDLSAVHAATPAAPDGPVHVMLGCHRGREVEKGADVLLPLLRELQDCNPQAMKLDFVQNVPYAEFAAILDRADIVVDQLYSYSPATTALMSLARGKCVVSGGEPEYYRFIGEDALRPLINVDPTDVGALSQRLQSLILDPSQLPAMAGEGRTFVAKHNDVHVVARRFDTFWKSRF